MYPGPGQMGWTYTGIAGGGKPTEIPTERETCAEAGAGAAVTRIARRSAAPEKRATLAARRLRRPKRDIPRLTAETGAVLQ